ncbi:MAG: hypothetical protein PHU73_03150 [Patescibacteria group bacterium]|nr:hypothetical protein [Patescibacteria group bacterium]
MIANNLGIKDLSSPAPVATVASSLPTGRQARDDKKMKYKIQC